MRVSRIAALVVGVTAVARGQSSIVPGDSVRVTRTTSESQIGTVQRLDRDSLILQNGSAFPLAALQQIETRGQGGPHRFRRFGFGLIGGIAGLAAGTLIGCGDECGGYVLGGMAAGVGYGATYGSRRKGRVWLVTWTPQHNIETVVFEQSNQAATPTTPVAVQSQGAVVIRPPVDPNTVPTVPPLEPALLSKLRVGAVLRVWADSARYDGRFVRVDADQRVLHLRNAARELPLSQIDVVHVRVNRTAQYALIVGAIAATVTYLGYSFDCATYWCAERETMVGVGKGAVIGIAVGAMFGSGVEDWRTLFVRSP